MVLIIDIDIDRYNVISMPCFIQKDALQCAITKKQRQMLERGTLKTKQRPLENHFRGLIQNIPFPDILPVKSKKSRENFTLKCDEFTNVSV